MKKELVVGGILGLALLPLSVRGELVISEIMYHPTDPSGDEKSKVEDKDEFEFIELLNIGDSAFPLAGVKFTEGIEFEFEDGEVAPGKTVLLAKNKKSFAIRYGKEVEVLGEYDGGLKNSGEKLSLKSAKGAVLHSFSYKDKAPWPKSADGLGFSIELKTPKGRPDHGKAESWRASTKPGGSPGVVEQSSSSPGAAPKVLVNEVLVHTDFPQVDAIELYNPGDAEVDVSGWFLTDDKSEPKKYKIIDGSKIAPKGYLVVKEDNDGNPDNNDSLPPELFGKSFSLSSHGEQVYLFSADGEGNLTGYTHGFGFEASENGVAFGRVVTSDGKERFPAMAEISLGKENGAPKKPRVAISEIMYHPADEDNDPEWVEIVNTTDKRVALFDPLHQENTWQLKGVKFTFPANVGLDPGETAVISNLKPSQFREMFPDFPSKAKLFGPFKGTLANGGERISLLWPDTPDDETGEVIVPMIEMDTIRYNDKDPWPSDADGTGMSLERDLNAPFGDDVKAWKSSKKEGGTPGVVKS